MRLQTRKLLDLAFSGSGILAIALMAAALLILLTPIFIRGSAAIFFTATVEHRRIMLEKFERGNRTAVEAEIASARAAREPVYRTIADFEKRLSDESGAERVRHRKSLKELKTALHVLLGPAPGDARPMLMRDQYGQTRWDRAGVKFADADLMGHPWQIVVGPRGAAKGMVELKRRATGEKQELSLADALARIL